MLHSAVKIVPNLYRDSVSLMQLSAEIGKLPGVEQASAVMATPANLDLLREAGLLEGKVTASPNDLVVALRGKSGRRAAGGDRRARSARSTGRPRAPRRAARRRCCRAACRWRWRRRPTPTWR